MVKRDASDAVKPSSLSSRSFERIKRLLKTQILLPLYNDVVSLKLLPL